MMKKNIIVFGLIAGLILAAVMLVSISICYKSGNFEGNMVLGYASMIIAFSMIFVCVKNFRDKHNGGAVSFGEAFKIGIYISLIASTIYVLAWLVDYYLFIPDFMDKYSSSMIQKAAAGNAGTVDIKAKTDEMEMYKEMYKNPLFVILFTYLEVFPIGLVVSLICAFILKRRVAGN